MTNSIKSQILKQLVITWPTDSSIKVEGDEIKVVSPHPLSREIEAFQNGETASLPYYSSASVIWMTTAPSATQLFSGIEDLRAWIIPSYGWEDPTQPLVVPGGAVNELSRLIHEISPSGYFRWWSLTTDTRKVMEKLSLMRVLADGRPKHVLDARPSLFELRNDFASCLITGDRDGGQAIIDLIDNFELDSAVNTRFMQIRLWDQFRESAKLVSYPQLSEVVQIRVPKLVRCAILRAFHDEYLSRPEERGDLTACFEQYAVNVHPSTAGLIGASTPEDGHEIARLIAYKARYDSDSQAVFVIRENTSDEFVTRLLSDFVVESTTTLSLTDRFWVGLQKEDWSEVQRCGFDLLTGKDGPEGMFSREFVRSALVVSLNTHANIELKGWLGENELTVSTGKPDATIATHLDLKDAPPQSWPEFIEYVRSSRLELAEVFITLDDRPSANDLTTNEIVNVLDDIEDLLTDPNFVKNHLAYQTTIGSVSAILGDLLTDSLFPQSRLTPIYRKLFEIWSDNKKGSALIPDSNVLLTLGESLLVVDAAFLDVVVDKFRNWWQVRRAKALLPFLLAAVDLISEFTEDHQVAENLWLDGAGLINSDPTSITPTERLIWQAVGRRIGLDDSTIREFLAVDPNDEFQAVDPFAGLTLNKIAIVSLREKAAESAAELIRERTNADVIVVSKTAAGSETDNAKTADIILFVWACATHAVYRAFDGVRDKLAYVQGTGASSIVCALEHWAQKQVDEV